MRRGNVLAWLGLVVSGCVDLGTPSPRPLEMADGPVDVDAAAPDVDVDAPDPVSPADGPRANGARCGAGSECGSGICAQGVCCAASCEATCHSCALVGWAGTCSPVPAGEDPLDACPDMGSFSCGSDGTCDGQGQCRRYGPTAVCAAGSCTGGVETTARTCDGQGGCKPAVTRSCSPKLCGGDSCALVCAEPAGCAAGYACRAGQCTSLAVGLVAYWKLDETASAATALDSSGNGFDAVDSGGSTVSPAPDHPARFGNPNARRFSRADDPTPDGLRVASPGSRLQPASWSISAWFKATSTDALAGTLVSMGDNYILGLRPDGRVTAIRHRTGDWFGCDSAGTYLDDRWHHAVATSTSGAAVAIWVDGARVTCSNDSGVQAYDLGTDLFIGRHGNAGVQYDFDGTLDDIRIYDRVLEDNEILALYAGQ